MVCSDERVNDLKNLMQLVFDASIKQGKCTVSTLCIFF